MPERYGWLANLIATTTISFFRLLESYLKFCFSMLQSGEDGFLLLIIIHVTVIGFITVKL